MKLIPLSQGKFAAVDDADHGWLSKINWYAKKCLHTWYAATNVGRGKNRTTLRMHQLLCPNAKGKIDHLNRDGLSNFRSNLRPATHSQNQANRAKNVGKLSSKFKGVCLRKENGTWTVHIAAKTVGTFRSEIDAAKAYDKAALAKWGAFARLNFPANDAKTQPPPRAAR